MRSQPAPGYWRSQPSSSHAEAPSAGVPSARTSDPSARSGQSACIAPWPRERGREVPRQASRSGTRRPSTTRRARDSTRHSEADGAAPSRTASVESRARPRQPPAREARRTCTDDRGNPGRAVLLSIRTFQVYESFQDSGNFSEESSPGTAAILAALVVDSRTRARRPRSQETARPFSRPGWLPPGAGPASPPGPDGGESRCSAAGSWPARPRRPPPR
jgi:hypothetical protein